MDARVTGISAPVSDHCAKFKIRKPFAHRENYGPFVELLDRGKMTIKTEEINDVTYEWYLNSLVAFMVDGIEDRLWHGDGKVNVIFTDGESCVLTINDLLANLIMWFVAVKSDSLISSRFLFWDEAITQKTITSYINRNFLENNYKRYNNIYLNRVIADSTALFSLFDRVSKYIADNMNLHDDVLLQRRVPDYYDLLHRDYGNQSLDSAMGSIMDDAYKASDIIKDAKRYLGYEHCLSSNLRTGEALNIRQFAETHIAIGSKPDAEGNVYPYIISSSFINGGVSDDIARYIESAGGKKALILSHMNVSESGYIARKLTSNNQHTVLNDDPNYKCDTKNLLHILIKDKDILYRLDKRNYKDTPFGVTKTLRRTDLDMIGKYIWMYSPMTCASYSRGQGICYQCYGDVAYVNSDINIGVMAAESLSNALTQSLLSAKHLLKVTIDVLQWVSDFYQYFIVDTDQIMFAGEETDGYKIVLETANLEEDEDLFAEGDEDDETGDLMTRSTSSNMHVTEFTLVTPEGDQIPIKSEKDDKLYLSAELAGAVHLKLARHPDAETISVDISSVGTSLFSIFVANNELMKVIGNIDAILDKVNVTSSFTKDEILQQFLETLNNAGLTLNSVHVEVILANQIFAKGDLLNKPAWEYPNAEYEILSLSQALSRNPSVTLALSYQNIPKQLADPRTFRKTKPSICDLNVVKFPQELMQTIPVSHKPDESYDSMSAPALEESVETPELVNPFIFK